MFNYALAFVITGQFLVVGVPYLQAIFQTQPLLLKDWIVLIAVSSFVFWAEELRKYLYREQHQNSYLPLADLENQDFGEDV